jgi:hypothetical protein
MTRRGIAAGLVLSATVLSSSALLADVRADEKSHVEFAGMLGRMVNLFGGKAAREGVATTVAVKGNRKASLNEATGQIVDLDEEKVYDLDIRRKSYKATTFAELRRRMEEERKKAEENAQKQQERESKDKQSSARPADEKQMEVDFDVKNTGQKKTINGFDTHEVVMTITVREKGKTLEQSGGLVMTSDMWMAPRIAAMKEVVDFDRRYFEKLYGPMIVGASPEQMATALAMYPMLKPAMARANTEGAKMDGTAIQTTTTVDAVKSADQMAQEQKQKDDDSKSSAAAGPGSLMGAFAKKMAQKKAQGGDDGPKARATFMTLNSEILKVTTDVAAGDVAVPAGFKEGR